MSEVPMAAADAVVGELVTHAVSLHAASGGDLLGCFASVVDPRDPRGVRHSLATILAMCTAAVLCGCTSLDDITAWVGSVDRGVLAVLGCRRNALEVLTPPRPETVTRVFAELGAQALAGHAGVLLARRAGLYLLAAATHDRCAVVAERLIGPKSTEVPQFAPLLRELNDHVGLSGHVVTVDAGHTVRAHATFLCEELGAHYIMTVKTTTPTLFATLDALDWTTVAVGHSRSPRRWPRYASPACPPARPHPSTSPATSTATGP